MRSFKGKRRASGPGFSSIAASGPAASPLTAADGAAADALAFLPATERGTRPPSVLESERFRLSPETLDWVLTSAMPVAIKGKYK